MTWNKIVFFIHDYDVEATIYFEDLLIKDIITYLSNYL